jgi:hypothetical protein
MRRRHFLAAAIAVGQLAQGQAGQNCPVQPVTWKAMRNCYRPVVVFAPGARNATLVAQQALLDDYADDMMDRNLLYVPVLADGGRSHFNPPLDAPYVLLDPTEMSSIRSRFKVSPSEFAVVLVGKDGGEKFRSTKPVSVLKLDALVDAMPMGAEEKAARAARNQ